MNVVKVKEVREAADSIIWSTSQLLKYGLGLFAVIQLAVQSPAAETVLGKYTKTTRDYINFSSIIIAGIATLATNNIQKAREKDGAIYTKESKRGPNKNAALTVVQMDDEAYKKFIEVAPYIQDVDNSLIDAATKEATDRLPNILYRLFK